MNTDVVRAVRAALLTGALLTGLGLVAVPAAQAAPPPPTVTYGGPGPNSNNDPEFFLHPAFAGEAQAYSTVRIYDNAACTGTSLGEGPADYAGHWIASTTVEPGESVTVWANATDDTGTSACSTTSKPWSVPPRPDTKITKTPPKVVKYNADNHIDGIYVTFGFKSTTGGKRFECTLDKRAFACEGKKRVRLNVEVGKHKFTVRALDSTYRGLKDKSPASYKFKLEDK